MKGVFLDRDGVLNDVIMKDGLPHPPGTVDEFQWLPGVREACEELHRGGFGLAVLTNQPDIARGALSVEKVESINGIVRRKLPVAGVLTCPHDGPDGCPCRKPKPGLILEAARAWDMDLHGSFMVGDRWSDIEAGRSAGCRAILIERPYSRREKCRPDWIVADLPQAARLILSEDRRNGESHD